MRGLTLIFLELWGATQKAAPGRALSTRCALHRAGECRGAALRGQSAGRRATGENVYLNMIRSAKDYVYITTPYLILSDEMQHAAAGRVQRR